MKAHTDKERHSFYVTKPLRKVSYNTKMKNDKEYLRHWIFWIFNQTTWNNWVVVNDEENYSETLQDLYEIAAGDLPKEWFHKVSNTLNLTHLKNKKIENYNLLYPDLQKLLGEKIERPLNYQIYNKGYDSSREFQEELNKQVYYTFIEEFNNPEVDPKLLEKLEKEVEEFKLKYKDNRAYRGQKILDVIIEEDKIHNKLIECWKHYLIAGQTCGQIKIQDGELNFIPISPQHIEYGRSSMDYDGKFISNADWVCVKYKWSVSKILDELGDELPNSIIEDLDSKYSPRTSWFRTLFYPEYQYKRDSIESEEEIDVFYMEWIVFEKYGILKYLNPMTYEEEYIEVDELYKPSKDQEIEWFWRKEAWSGWLIDNHITCKIKRLDIQNGKLQFLGYRYNDLHTIPISITKLGLPYQKLWLVIWNKIEGIIAKSMGEIALIPIQLITGGEGNQEYDFTTALNVGRETGVIPYNMADPMFKGIAANNWLGKANLSAVGEMQFYVQLLDRVQASWKQLIGFTSSRMGQQKASQGVGSVQSELIQSLSMSEYLFYTFEEFEKELLTNLLELSKFAYIDGKWINIRTEEDIKFLDIDPVDHANTHYGLFLVNSNKETKQLDMFKEVAMQRANQGATPTELLELITGTSTAEIKKIMNELAKKEQERIERESQSEQEAQERLKQLEIEMLTIKNNLDIEKEIKITEGKFPFERELELLKIEGNMASFQGTLDTNEDNQPDILEVEKRSIERMKVMGDLLTKNKELILKEKEIESKERIEKEKNKTALKNKVTGEK